MPVNISSGSVDLENLFAARVGTAAANDTGYRSVGTDIRQTFEALVNASDANKGARINATSLTTSATGYSANTDLASIFCGNAGQYAVTTPANGTKTLAPLTVSTTKTITHTLTVTFTTAAALTNYFLYGGRILISASQSGANACDIALNNMLVSMGTLVIWDTGHYRTGAGGTIANASVGGSNIGTGSTSMYTLSGASPYASNSYSVAMVANAAAGSATVLTITITLLLTRGGTVADVYAGTYSSTVQQRNYSPTNGGSGQSVPTFGGSIV